LFQRILYPEHIYQHTGCDKNNVLEYVRGFFKHFK